MRIWLPSTSSSRRSRNSVSSRRVRATRLLPLVGLMACAAGPVGAATATLDEAVQRLEATYRGIRDLKADFQQAAFNRTLNQTLEARGTFYLKKPGKLRWEYTTPTPQ